MRAFLIKHILKIWATSKLVIYYNGEMRASGKMGGIGMHNLINNI